MLLDSGNFSDAHSPAGTVKTRALLQGMGDLGYAVVNVGERDIRFGYDLFAENIAGSELPFISANIVEKHSGKPILPSHVVIEANSANGASTVRVGVIGAMRFNPIFLQPGPNGHEMVITHPKEQVEKALKALRKDDVDFVVLLAAMHRDDARRIVNDLPSIDFVVGSYGGVFSTEHEAQADSWILYSGNQGKRIGVTRIFFDESGELADQNTTLHLMTSIYPADPVMLDFVNSVPLPKVGTLGARIPSVSAPVSTPGER